MSTSPAAGALGEGRFPLPMPEPTPPFDPLPSQEPEGKRGLLASWVLSADACCCCLVGWLVGWVAGWPPGWLVCHAVMVVIAMSVHWALLAPNVSSIAPLLPCSCDGHTGAGLCLHSGARHSARQRQLEPGLASRQQQQ